MKYNLPIKQRLLEGIKHNTETNCWEWKTKNACGYGNFKLKGKTHLAHRISMMAFKRFNINNKKLILHKCDNRICINPSHLFIGTQRDNILDTVNKGRHNPPIGERNAYAKLTRKQVNNIRLLYTNNKTIKEISNKYNISTSHTRRIVNNQSWRN